MLAVTGANGHLGQRLLASLGARPVRALVRSSAAAERVRQRHGAAVDVRVVDYRDPRALQAALAACTRVVHLVGIIRETRGNAYRDAHEATCEALVEAAAGVGLERIVYLSILGAEPASANPCLASKGMAERILADGPIPTTTLRVPMVLGEDDHASRGLARRAQRRVNVLLRGASLEQPIYAGDVIAALWSALAAPAGAGHAAYDLAGPESLPRRELVRRAARLLGRQPRMVSVPLGTVLGPVRLLEGVGLRPPVGSAMLGVLDHDDCIDPTPAAAALGVRLTPLDETLRRCIAAAGGGPAVSAKSIHR